MEQLLVVLGVIVWLVLRGAGHRGGGRPSGTGGPLTTDQLQDSIEDAQERALKALERWEDRQKPAGGAAARSRERLARAARARESGEVDLRRFEVAAGRGDPPAGRTSRRGRAAARTERQAAYEAIAGMLGADARPESPPSMGSGPGGSVPDRQWLVPRPGQAGRAPPPASAPPPADAARRPGAADPPAKRPRITGRVVPRGGAPLDSALKDRRTGGLAGLRRLPELQRALVFHELLRPPPALRPGEPPGPA